MIKILSKILVMLIISILFFNISIKVINAAVEINIDKAFIEKIGQAEYHLKYYKKSIDDYTYLICDIVGFFDEKGNFNPAYCMNSDLTGAGKESYYVKIDNLLKNNKVWRVIKNGYPYKSAKELGLSSKYDAFAVTKFAVYCVLGEVRLDRFKAEKNDEEAVAMLKALKKLVDIGENGTEKQQDNPLSLSKVGEIKEDGEFFVQEYKLNSKSEFNTYEISKVAGLTEHGYIANIQGDKATRFKVGENFKVVIPKDEVNQNLEIKITAQAECKSYIILEGKTTVTNTQNYVVTAGEYAAADTNTTLNIEPKNASIIINKVSEDNETPIEGVKFELYKDKILIAKG